MRKVLFIIWSILSLTVQAQELSESAYASLVTCTPGRQLYARYGHSAIRVVDQKNGMDWIFNYGLFSFDTDHFYWKFVKGETYYQLGVQYTEFFMDEYNADNRPVYEQVLNLDSCQVNNLFKALIENYQPENRTYLYNFVFDNCATRPYFLIKKALNADTILSSYAGWNDKSYREFIHHYTGPYSWEDFGINMIFGKRADRKMHGDSRLFLPEELMMFVSEAKLPNGERLVKSENIQPFVIAKTPWYADCRFGIILFAIIMAGISLYDRKRKQMTYWVDIAMGTVYVALLAIVIFLTFFSIHPLVGFNWRLALLPFIHLCTRLIYIIK